MAELPTGTVTFLFTDIEGSTQLLHRLGDEYAGVLADQRQILRATFADWDGHEVDTQGDAFFVSFTRSTDAVAAAVEGQRALAAHEWPGGITVRVRMGLHTGEPIVSTTGYVGIAVHRAARICHIGYGEQVLLSESTAILCRDELLAGVRLLDLGKHQLKDLQRQERIYQLVIPGLITEFPPLKSLNALPNNLPTQLTSFVRREEEMEQIESLLNEGRLVTLTGPGGAGKTRLSLQVAADIVENFADGVWYVELAPLISPNYMVPAVANALNFSIDSYTSDLDSKSQLLDYLGGRSILMVMDNFEHLVEGAELLTDMLEGAPELKIMVTSRERLNLQEEWTFDVKGMNYPSNGDGAGTEAYNALALFVRRAQQVNSDFKLTEDEKPCVIRICQLVEGMPLAIELAAAWASTLSCKEIAEEIEKSLDFLTTSMRDIPDKHHSLRAVFDNSWQSLTEVQKAGFRKLSVFRGGFEREAALTVANVNLQMLAEFLDKSLIKRDVQGRYSMHQLLREYAQEKLREEPSERDAARERHSQYFTSFLIEHVLLILGEKMIEIREKIRIELTNLRDAIYWAITHWDEDQARTLVTHLAAFYYAQGWRDSIDAFQDITHYLKSHGAAIEAGAPRRALLISTLSYQNLFSSILGDLGAEERCLEYYPTLSEPGYRKELGMSLYSLGVCDLYRGKYAESIQCLEDSLPYLRESQDTYLIASCYLWIGWVYHELGDYVEAGVQFQESYQLCKQQDNRIMFPYALDKLGIVADALGEYPQALRYHQEALEIFEQQGNQAGQGYALARMSLTAWSMGEYEEAIQYGRESYEHFLSIGHRWGTSYSLCRIGFAELGLGNNQKARDNFYEGLQGAMEHDYVSISILALLGLGCLWTREGEEVHAAELFGLAIHHPITPAIYKEIAQAELDKLESEVPPEVLTTAIKKGRSSDFDQVVEAILRERVVFDW